jgi:hypothetical protein
MTIRRFAACLSCLFAALSISSAASAVTLISDPASSTVRIQVFGEVSTTSGQFLGQLIGDETFSATGWITAEFNPQPTPMGDPILEGWEWLPPASYPGVISATSFGGEILLTTGGVLPYTM